jgi:MSHA pilin protein MshA
MTSITKAIQKGFTLIELIVVIVILGILAAVAIPQFTDISDQARLAVGQAACGSLHTSSVMYYASNKAATPFATLTGATVVQSGTTSAGTWGGTCAAPTFTPTNGSAVACAAIPTTFCS